ncbi:MAG: MerR family transcriptional regulator [Candidatus Caenarcaniphilales bacterium]|nr:MerR family transcriptional regulator [Candidatus Caenarcaniphilales bacterium]
MSENNLITVKELAAKLEVTDLLLKKLIKFFEIPSQKIKRSINLDEAAVETVKKIVELKAEGKRNKDIKQLFDEQKKREQKKAQDDGSEATESEAGAVAEVAGDKTADTTNVEAKLEDENSKADTSSEAKATGPVVKEDKPKQEEASEAKTESKEESKDEAKEEVKSERSSRNNNNRRKKSPRKDNKAKEDNEKVKEDSEEAPEEESEPDYIKSYIESEEIEAKFDVEQDDPVAEALALDEDDEENADDLEDIDDLDEEEVISKDSISPRKVKRKAFSFRYIQRQIASDTKKVNFLKNKLKKGKLSHLERLNLRDSLDRRAKMLSSWIQILRWVKS